jgi:uncharacterized membrane protein YtjA (UPF0391 family)
MHGTGDRWCLRTPFRTVSSAAKAPLSESNVIITKVAPMLHYAVVFLVIALIAAVFGFGGIAASAAGIAKILFVIFLIGAVVAFLMNGRGTRI